MICGLGHGILHIIFLDEWIMAIAIDASRAFVVNRTGIEEYAYQVVKHLREPLAEASVVLYVRFHGEAAEDPREWIESHFFALPESWRVVRVPRKRLWTQLGLAHAMWRDRPDALFVPAHTVPWIHPENTVVVVHGLEYEMTPQAYSAWARFYMRATIGASCRWARQIITVSENTKRDVARLYGVAADKMTVVYEGVNPAMQTDAHASDVPYFLFVGRIEERKNIARVVAAFDAFKTQTGLSHQLILAGRPCHGYADVAQAIATAKYKDDIVERGFVSEEEKWQLMRSAQAFVFATLYEGFGLPILEAQRCGVPVIASDNSSIPEVVGADVHTGADASALMVDPYDAASITAAMMRVVTDTDLVRDIITKGQRNTERFTWAQCAREIAQVLVK